MFINNPFELNLCMKKKQLLLLACAFFIIGCSHKKPKGETKDPGFPILPFIKTEVAHVDTSLFAILQLNYIDSNRIDTIYHSREEFRKLATDFLSLPDLTDKSYTGRYKEEVIYDDMLGRAIIVSLPVDPAREIIQRQELVVTPDPSGGESKINNIIIDYLLTSKDSSVEKKMLWLADKSFQVTTIKQLPGKPETITTTKIIWNEPQDQ